MCQFLQCQRATACQGQQEGTQRSKDCGCSARSDRTVSAPKPNRAAPTETSKRFLQTPKAGYGYTESPRDEGDGRRYPGAITNAAWAFVATTDREGCGVGEKGGTQHRRQR